MSAYLNLPNNGMQNGLNPESTAFGFNPQAQYEELFRDPAIDQEMPYMPGQSNFRQNLAFKSDEGLLRRLGSHLSDAIDLDNKSRDKWLRIVSDGIDYLGMGGDKSKASNDIYASTLLNVILNSTSELHSAIFQSGGFVETEIFGNPDPEKEDRAIRIKEFFHYMTTSVMKEYKSDKKQALFWMIMCGSVFSKIYIDPIKGKPCAPYIRPQDIIVDAGATSLEDAERVTHRFILSKRQVEEKFNSGAWKRVHLEPHDVSQDVIKVKTDEKSGVSSQSDDEQKIYCFDECICYWDMNNADSMYAFADPQSSYNKPLPYVVIKDRNSDAIVAMYNNWNEYDPSCKSIQYLVHHKYFTGFDFWGLGIFHLALGLARLETEIQQEFVKGVKLANAPVLMQASGLRSERTQYDNKPGSIVTFQTFDNNINNAMQPIPFPQPNPVMLQFKQLISESINNIIASRQLKFSDIPANTSATTMMGIMSKMHTQEISLLNDLYDSFRLEFELLFNAFGEWLPNEPYPFNVPGGQYVIMKQDFQPDIAIRPVLDPNVSSQTLKMMQSETVLSLATQAPQLYNLRNVHKHLLENMQVADIDSVLIPEPSEQMPPDLDPVSEFGFVMSNKPIQVYKHQDHQSHMTVHQYDLGKIMNDQTQDHGQQIGALQAHINSHMYYQTMMDVEARTGIPFPDDPNQMPPEMKQQVTMMSAQAVLQKQQEEQAQNPPPPDPNEILAREVEQKAQHQEMQFQLDQQKIEREERMAQLKANIELERIELEKQRLIMEKEKFEREFQMAMEKEETERMRIQMEMQRDQEKYNLEAQSKAYDSTLRHDTTKEVEYAKIASDHYKTDLDAETKAFEATLSHRSGEHDATSQHQKKDEKE